MARRVIAILSLGVLLAAGMVTSASAATSVAPNCGITWGSLPKTAVGTAVSYTHLTLPTNREV